MTAYAVPPAIAYALLHSLWQGALIALAAAGSFALLRRRGAAARHVVGLIALLAMVAAPLATFALYRHAPASAAVTGAASPGDPIGPVMMRGADWLALGVPALWLVGAGVMIVRLVAGWRQLGALEHRPSRVLSPGWQRRVDALRPALGIARRVAVRHAGDATSPFTTRTLRPVIWLPVSRLAAMPDEQRDALLAHELAHVRRLDWLWNSLQCAAEAVLCFHPAVWWLGRRVRQDREHACDDLAVAACGSPIVLAEALAALAQRRRAHPTLALAARDGALLPRVTYLLSGSAARVQIRVLAGLAILLCAGTAIAIRIELPRDMLVNLRVDAPRSGAIAPAASVEITADAFSARHHYRRSTNAQGRTLESYEQDGEPRPIDPAVRAWLDGLARTGR